MKYGKVFIGKKAVVTALYDGVEPGTQVEILSLTPNVGIYLVSVLSGTLKNENRLIHSTRLNEVDAQPITLNVNEAGKVENTPVKEEAKVPEKKLNIVKVNELAYGVKVAVIERNRAVNLKQDAFQEILNDYLAAVGNDTIFLADASAVICQLPGIGLGLLKNKITVNALGVLNSGCMLFSGLSENDRLATSKLKIKIEPIGSAEAIGYFYSPAVVENQIERWAQSTPDNYKVIFEFEDANTNEAYMYAVLDVFDKEFKKFTELSKKYYRLILDKFEVLTSDVEVEKALKPLWYLENGEVVPVSMLQALGVK